jgi:hypothetical protein
LKQSFSISNVTNQQENWLPFLSPLQSLDTRNRISVEGINSQSVKGVCAKSNQAAIGNYLGG